MSCLAEQAKILFAEAEENNLDDNVIHERFKRWRACSLCKQDYHGVVACALGWACWKTYLRRPEADEVRVLAMGQLGNGLEYAGRHKDALTVKGAELSTMRRVGASEHNLLITQGNLASTFNRLGRREEGLSLLQDVYSGWLKLEGEENEHTVVAALNYGDSLIALKRLQEAESLLRKTIPVARRVLGSSDITTLRMRHNYAEALYKGGGATLDELREVVTTVEDTERIARRVFGGAHPFTEGIEGDLRISRKVLRAREDGKKVKFV